MKKLLSIFALTGAAIGLAACQEQVKQAGEDFCGEGTSFVGGICTADAQAPVTPTTPSEVVTFKASQKSITLRYGAYDHGYIAFAYVATNADGIINAFDINEIQPATTWNATQFTATVDAAHTVTVKSSTDATKATNVAYAKYLKVGDKVFVFQTKASVFTGTETAIELFGAYVEADATTGLAKESGLKLVTSTDYANYDALASEYKKTIAPADSKLASITEAKAEIVQFNAETGAFVSFATKTYVKIDKKSMGYGRGSYNYSKSMGVIENYVVRNTKSFLDLELAAFKVKDAASNTTELKGITGSTASYTNGYLHTAKDVLATIQK